METLYDRIVLISKACGFKNITELCEHSGASRGSLTDLKSGRKKSLSIETIGKLADSLGMTIDELAGREQAPEKPATPKGNGLNQKVLALAEKLSQMSVEDLELLNAQADVILSRRNKK